MLGFSKSHSFTKDHPSRSLPSIEKEVLTDRFAGSDVPCKDLNKYCGGTWNGTRDKLDYIQGMGFDAIWISPIVHNINDGYHGYWQDDLYRLNEHFGTEQDLINLIYEAHRRGIWVMVDVVANHMLTNDMKQFPNGISPFNRLEHYHSCSVCPKSCNVEDWSNQQQVEDCKLFDLPDLNQTNPFVGKTLNNWIKSTVSKYKFDGVRIDTLCEVPKWFWKEFQQSSGVYCMGEAANVDIGYVGGYQLPKGTLDGVLSFPLFYRIQWVFANQQTMMNLQEVNQLMPKHFGNPKHIGVFMENHDQPRFARLNNDIKPFKAALTYTILSAGIPIIYQGTKQHFDGGDTPWNREAIWTTGGYSTTTDLYNFVKILVTFRKKNQLWMQPQIERYASFDFYAFSRGNVLVCLTNKPNVVVKYTITYHPYKVGQKLCNLLWSSDCLVVTKSGVDIILNFGESKVFYPSN